MKEDVCYTGSEYLNKMYKIYRKGAKFILAIVLLYVLVVPVGVGAAFNCRTSAYGAFSAFCHPVDSFKNVINYANESPKVPYNQQYIDKIVYPDNNLVWVIEENFKSKDLKFLITKMHLPPTKQQRKDLWCKINISTNNKSGQQLYASLTSYGNLLATKKYVSLLLGRGKFGKKKTWGKEVKLAAKKIKESYQKIEKEKREKAEAENKIRLNKFNAGDKTIHLLPVEAKMNFKTKEVQKILNNLAENDVVLELKDQLLKQDTKNEKYDYLIEKDGKALDSLLKKDKKFPFYFLDNIRLKGSANRKFPVGKYILTIDCKDAKYNNKMKKIVKPLYVLTTSGDCALTGDKKPADLSITDFCAEAIEESSGCTYRSFLEKGLRDCRLEDDDERGGINVSGINPLGTESMVGNIFSLINRMVDVFAKMVAAVAVFFLVFAGLTYVRSAGDTTRVAIAKKILFGTVTAILIMFMAYIIVVTIVGMLYGAG